MWILAKSGFTSTVNYDPSKDRDPKSPFPAFAKQAGTHKLIRARRMEHLEPIKRIVPNLTLVDDRHADYRFRCVIRNEDFIKFLVSEVNDIDYWSHFKEAMKAAQPAHLAMPMYSAAMKVWGIFASLQASQQYNGRDSGTAPKHTSVADYQADKGVKPFKSSVVEDPDVEAWWDTDELRPTFDGVALMNTDQLVSKVIGNSGRVQFSAGDMAIMTDEAFELMTRLQEKYGANASVSPTLVTKARDELRSETVPPTDR